MRRVAALALVALVGGVGMATEYPNGAGLPSGIGAMPPSTVAGSILVGSAGTFIESTAFRAGSFGLRAPDGTVAAPAFSFVSETGTGWWRAGAGRVQMSVTGVSAFIVDATDGTTAAGRGALDSLTALSGLGNTGFGENAGTSVTTGDFGVYLGFGADAVAADDSGGVSVGYTATSGTNAIAAGNAASAPDNTIAIAYGGAEQITGTTGTVTFAPGIDTSVASLASDPAVLLSGAFFSGGTGTTTFPHVLIQPSGATAATDWSTSGTAFGVNADLAAGTLIDAKVDGTSKFRVDGTGELFPSVGVTLGGGTAHFKGSANPNLFVSPANAAHRPLLIRGAAAQSANLTEWEDTNSKTLAVVDLNGNLGLYGNTITGNAVAAVATVSRAVTANVATLVTAAHSIVAGQYVSVTGMGDAAYNGTYVVASTPTTTSITYALVHGDEGTTADAAGTVTPQGTRTDVAEVTATANADRGFRRVVTGDLGSADVVDGVYDNNGTALMTVNGGAGVTAGTGGYFDAATFLVGGDTHVSSAGYYGRTAGASLYLGSTGNVRWSDAASGTDGTQVQRIVETVLTTGTMTKGIAQSPPLTVAFTWTNAMVTALGAVTSGDITVGTLPAKTVVLNAYMVVGTAETALTSLTGAVGRTGATYIDYIVASNLKAAANTVYGDGAAERGTNLTGYDLPSYTGTTPVNLHLISGVENLDTAVACTGTVFVTYQILP